MEFVKMWRFLLKATAEAARRYSLRAAKAKRKSSFRDSGKAPTWSPTYWLFYAAVQASKSRRQPFIKALASRPIRGLVGVAFMIHAIVFAAVALFALIGALTA